MKKIMYLSIVILSIAIFLCGCAKKEQGNLLSKIYKVPQKLIYINVPDEYEETQIGYSKIYFKKNKKYIAITAEKSMETTEIMKAQDIVFSKLKKNVNDLTYINSLEIEQEKIEKVNDIEMYMYEGKLICGRTVKTSVYVVGYTFIIDKIPCNITGVVTEKEQNDETIQDIKNMVDGMAKTVRNTKELL